MHCRALCTNRWYILDCQALCTNRVYIVGNRVNSSRPEHHYVVDELSYSQLVITTKRKVNPLLDWQFIFMQFHLVCILRLFECFKWISGWKLLSIQLFSGGKCIFVCLSLSSCILYTLLIKGRLIAEKSNPPSNDDWCILCKFWN